MTEEQLIKGCNFYRCPIDLTLPINPVYLAQHPNRMRRLQSYSESTLVAILNQRPESPITRTLLTQNQQTTQSFLSEMVVFLLEAKAYLDMLPADNVPLALQGEEGPAVEIRQCLAQLSGNVTAAGIQRCLALKQNDRVDLSVEAIARLINFGVPADLQVQSNYQAEAREQAELQVEAERKEAAEAMQHWVESEVQKAAVAQEQAVRLQAEIQQRLVEQQRLQAEKAANDLREKEILERKCAELQGMQDNIAQQYAAEKAARIQGMQEKEQQRQEAVRNLQEAEAKIKIEAEVSQKLRQELCEVHTQFPIQHKHAAAELMENANRAAVQPDIFMHLNAAIEENNQARKIAEATFIACQIPSERKTIQQQIDNLQGLHMQLTQRLSNTRFEASIAAAMSHPVLRAVNLALEEPARAGRIRWEGATMQLDAEDYERVTRAACAFASSASRQRQAEQAQEDVARARNSPYTGRMYNPNDMFA